MKIKTDAERNFLRSQLDQLIKEFENIETMKIEDEAELGEVLFQVNILRDFREFIDDYIKNLAKVLKAFDEEQKS